VTISRRTLSRTLRELVSKGFLVKVALSKKRVYYVCPDPYLLEVMMRRDWHEFGRPTLEEYIRWREKGGKSVRDTEEAVSFFISLAYSNPKAYVDIEIEKDKVLLCISRQNRIILETDEFLEEIKKEYGVSFINKELFTGKIIDANAASEQVIERGQLIENYTDKKKYFRPPILPKMNLGRCLETWSRTFGLLIGDEKDFERWGIKVKRNSLGYYFEDLTKVWEVKDHFRKAFNEYSRKETIHKISALIYLLWLNKERLISYVSTTPIVI